MSHPAAEYRDPGLQPERTLLSWQRTLVLMVVVGLLYMRGSLVVGESVVPQAPPAVRFGTVAALLLLSALLGVHLRRRWRHARDGRCDGDTGLPPMTLARPWAMVVLCSGILALSVTLVLTVLLAG